MRFFLGLSMAMHCSTNVLKLMCLRFCPFATEGGGDSDCSRLDAGATLGATRGGESRRNGRLGPHRVMCVSLLVCSSDGRTGLCAGPSDMICGASSSSDSGGLNMGDSGNSDVSSSQMDRCFKMGFRTAAVELSGVGEGHDGRSSAAVAL